MPREQRRGCQRGSYKHPSGHDILELSYVRHTQCDRSANARHTRGDEDRSTSSKILANTVGNLTKHKPSFGPQAWCAVNCVAVHVYCNSNVLWRETDRAAAAPFGGHLTRFTVLSGDGQSFSKWSPVTPQRGQVYSASSLAKGGPPGPRPPPPPRPLPAMPQLLPRLSSTCSTSIQQRQ